MVRKTPPRSNTSNDNINALIAYQMYSRGIKIKNVRRITYWRRCEVDRDSSVSDGSYRHKSNVRVEFEPRRPMRPRQVFRRNRIRRKCLKIVIYEVITCKNDWKSDDVGPLAYTFIIHRHNTFFFFLNCLTHNRLPCCLLLTNSF